MFSFVVMTAGLAFYQFLLAHNLIPPFLGGFLGAAAAVLCIPLMVMAVLYFVSRPQAFTHADGLVFAVTSLIALVGIFHIPTDYYGVALTNVSAATQILVMYFAYRFLEIERVGIYLLLAFMTAVLLGLGLGDVGAEAMELRANDPEIATYQAFAAAYLFVWLVAISCAQKHRHLLYAAGIVALFYNGARTQLIVAVLAVAICEIVRSRRNALVVLFSVFVVIGAYSTVTELLVDLYPGNRFVILMDMMTEDTSWQERNALGREATEVIERNPRLGDYGYYRPGEYAHDITSAWADYGLFGFVLFALSIGLPVWGAWKAFRGDWGGGGVMLFIITAPTAAVMFAFSKYYGDAILGVSLALYARYLECCARSVAVPKAAAASP